jgi:hypothetical protein
LPSAACADVPLVVLAFDLVPSASADFACAVFDFDPAAFAGFDVVFLLCLVAMAKSPGSEFPIVEVLQNRHRRRCVSCFCLCYTARRPLFHLHDHFARLMIEDRHPAPHGQPLESTAMELATKRVQKGDVHGR